MLCFFLEWYVSYIFGDCLVCSLCFCLSPLKVLGSWRFCTCLLLIPSLLLDIAGLYLSVLLCSSSDHICIYCQVFCFGTGAAGLVGAFLWWELRNFGVRIVVGVPSVRFNIRFFWMLSLIMIIIIRPCRYYYHVLFFLATANGVFAVGW